jgi:hypothetical protein
MAIKCTGERALQASRLEVVGSLQPALAPRFGEVYATITIYAGTERVGGDVDKGGYHKLDTTTLIFKR